MSDDLRGTIERVINEAETPSGGDSPVESVAVETPGAVAESTSAESPDGGAGEAAQAATPGRSRDTAGRFAPKDKAVAPAPKQGSSNSPPATASVSPPTDAAVAPLTPETPATPPTPTLKAPSSWKPAAREAFAKAPPEVQAEAVRVDYEVRKAMQESARARQFESEFSQATQPYAAMFQQAGLNPVQAAQSAFRTIHQLQSGDPRARAAIFADLMRTYPTDVEALAGAIDNPASRPAVDPEAIVRQAEERMMAKLEARQRQHLQAKTGQELETFAASHEFFEDVRHEMGGIMEAANVRSQAAVARGEPPIEMTLEEAYNRAIWANPEKRAIVQQREQAKSAATAQAATQRASVAASSVRNQPATPVNGATPGDLRSDINAAIAKLSGR